MRLDEAPLQIFSASFWHRFAKAKKRPSLPVQKTIRHIACPPKKGRKGNQKKGPDGVGLFSPRKGCCFPEGQRGPSKAATAFPPANVGRVGRGTRDGSGLDFAQKAKNEGQRRRRGMIASCDSEIVQRFGLFVVFVKLATDEKLRG